MREVLGKLGKRAIYTVNDLQIEIEITDARVVFGRIDYKIKPVAGKGEKWVSAESIMEVK